MNPESKNLSPKEISNFEINGYRIDVLEGAFSWYIRSLETVVTRDLNRRMEQFKQLRGKGMITALLLIDDYPGIRPSDIAGVLMRDRPATGRLVNKLVADRLVSRGSDDDDQRAQCLSITDKGHKLADQVRAVIREQEQEFFDFIPASEREQFMQQLQRVYTQLRDKWA